MCTRYISPEAATMESHWHIGRHNPWRGGEVFPNQPGPFIRAAREAAAPQPELVVGQWSLIPWFARERRLRFATSNARSEELAQKASYKDPWARGQRCLVPALAFFEPNWESGRHVPWIFRRADGLPWGLAGLWNAWADPQTGEIVESYTLLTINADGHPLMQRMHRPDPKRPPDRQDKRSVIPIEPEDADPWLFGTPAQASALLRLAPAELFQALPAAG
ncbi:MAG: SOS response-associated peptidase family protein [Burkholderiales bacterium]|nr:SOS response-associated peptidase family protein [Burkholderiales bacterium]